MFIAELQLYIDYLKEQLGDQAQPEPDVKKKKYIASFYANIRKGIAYYQQLPGVAIAGRTEFIKALHDAEQELDCLNQQYTISN
jgi:hypothetical protein